MDAGAAGDGPATARADAEKARVKLASESLAQFELFMAMCRDHVDGRFGALAADARR